MGTFVGMMSLLKRLWVGSKSYLFAGHTGLGLVLGLLYFPHQVCVLRGVGTPESR